jgi:hypothetical protein
MSGCQSNYMSFPSSVFLKKSEILLKRDNDYHMRLVELHFVKSQMQYYIVDIFWCRRNTRAWNVRSSKCGWKPKLLCKHWAVIVCVGSSAGKTASQRLALVTIRKPVFKVYVTTPSLSQTVVHKGRMIWWWWILNWTRYVKQQAWRYLRYNPSILLAEWATRWTVLIRTVSRPRFEPENSRIQIR